MLLIPMLKIIISHHTCQNNLKKMKIHDLLSIHNTYIYDIMKIYHIIILIIRVTYFTHLPSQVLPNMENVIST